MAYSVKVLDAKSNYVRSIPGPTWWKERTNASKLSTDFHVCVCSHKDINIYVNSFKKQQKPYHNLV